VQIITWEEFLQNGLPLGEKYSSMTVGVFDGVHRGHQALIERVVSHNINYTPVIITFRENHKTGNRDRKDIHGFRERLLMFEKLGIQIVIIADLTEKFRRMPGIDFLEIILKRGRIGFFAAGSDFRCGYHLDTDTQAIQKFFASHNIPAGIVPQVMEGSLPVSSSRIREAIAEGHTELAEKMLGDSA
jgi:riboflavin kinase/FMN adenylyltransferase